LPEETGVAVRDLPGGTVTFLFTDIEGSTRLLRELGERYADALVEHRRVVRAAIAVHGGIEVDTQGDAFFVVFPDAGEALDAAAAAREALVDGPIRIRMGLHAGRPGRIDEGYVGEDVHLGARVAAAAHGGQIVLTKAAADAVGRPLTDLGEHRVKDFAEPVWLFQLGTESFPPLRTISNSNLPRPASSFVGRDRELAEVRALLRESRLVTLTGPGGSGKTRLSIEAAADEVGEFRNGVYWVGLATIRDLELVVPEISKAIGAQNGLAEHVGSRELLLLLDNLEQVVDVAPVLADLVEACPNLTLLVTSRELLRVRGEVEYEVLPLADSDAVELFCARARLPFGPEIEQLCRRLDNMPLALELAAARAHALTPSQILERVGERLDMFRGGRDADPRQATLRATIEWSYDLLTPEEQRLFARLAVFAGGWTLESAEGVAQADLDSLQSLVEKSLVRQTSGRFWMLETIREYALERLVQSQEEPLLRRRHAEACLRVAESSGMAHESEEEERHDLVLPELDNIRGALEWAVQADPELGMRVVLGMEQFWVASDPFEGRRWFGALLDHRDIPDQMRAKALRCHGGLHWIVGDFEEGNQLQEESLELFRRLGDRRGEALVLVRSAVEAMRIGDLERARAVCEQSLEYFRGLHSAKGEAEALLILNYVLFKEGRFEESLELADQSAALAAQVGWRWLQSGALGAAAESALRLRRLDDAQSRTLKALAINREIGGRQWAVFSLALLAWVAAASGDAVRAGRLWGAIEAEAERGRIGQWEEGERDEYMQHVHLVAGPEFDRAVAEGRALRLDAAIDYALSVDSPS
jgi:predicted ATPase/class 3 adenylate cyclase